jgi:CubicO group peptidase (beta-lactamase class C family)
MYNNLFRFSFSKSLILPLLFLLVGNSTVRSQTFQPISVEEAGFSVDRLDRLTNTFNEYVAEGRLSGGVALVLKEGRPVYYEAFGKRDVESNDPMTKNTIFRIASQTKAIVSVGVMILQEHGDLLISDPISKYLPEFTSMKVAVRSDSSAFDLVDASRQITIRDLLTHSSGIGYGYGISEEAWKEAGIQGWYFADRDETMRESVRKMGLLPLNAQPGSQFVYGYSTDILGALIEVVSGQDLYTFLKDHILDPLEMTDTYFYLPSSKIGRLATVYSAVSGAGIVRAPNPGGSVGQGHYIEGPRKSLSGGAGLLSTANDYARFLQMMLNGGELFGTRILAPKTVELMVSDHLVGIELRAGVGVGLGFDIVKDVGARGTHGSLGDYGWGGAYHSTYWVSPKDQLVVVFFTQLIPATGSDIHGKLRALIYQAMIK